VKAGAHEHDDSDSRARRHRLCGRRAAAPDCRASALQARRLSCPTASRASRCEGVSSPGERLPDTASVAGGRREAAVRTPQTAVFSAAPHGVSAALIDTLLKAAPPPAHARGSSISRPTTATARRKRLRGGVQTPARRARALREFTCAVPEHLKKLETPHVAHPGCFATATLLASVPLLAGLVCPDAFRQRRDRQHRLRAQADRGHAPPAAAQRPV
jgi:hypothetical protein